ncbi:uncharacterized protein LOC113359913 [Papaver somniferum]|uniref:uncharacterized protein LOC113359913 n=1 Tax=Papaver somniferum TaxID=3469 RepID=UPI000E6F7FA5|nr:uncharacterized protein LOC113359913 [Papaver somniferum]
MKDLKWRLAMKNEVSALEANNTWTRMSLPHGKQPICCKWIYKIKYRPDGSIERSKACLVAKGYTQAEGIDYHDTFAPVAKLVTVRILLSVADVKGWSLHQLDVNNAFLQGDHEEEIYMKLPPEFSREGEHSGSVSLFVLVYVDDIIITGNNETSISNLKKFLEKSFSIKDLGKLQYFLGIEVSRSNRGIFLCQRKYILDILKDAGLTGDRTSDFPMEQQLRLKPNDGQPMSDPTIFRRLIGRLLYLTVTRPDITYIVNTLSQFMSNPHTTHMDVANRILRYLKGTIGKGLLLSYSNTLHLSGYCDSDWAGCPTTRRSTTGYFTILGTSPISWKTKKQVTISRSSAEAEYHALATLTCELQWLKYLLNDLDIPHSEPIYVFCDNQAAIHIAENPVFHERTKHIELD